VGPVRRERVEHGLEIVCQSQGTGAYKAGFVESDG
jgi:hypothetical protein